MTASPSHSRWVQMQPGKLQLSHLSVSHTLRERGVLFHVTHTHLSQPAEAPAIRAERGDATDWQTLSKSALPPLFLGPVSFVVSWRLHGPSELIYRSPRAPLRRSQTATVSSHWETFQSWSPLYAAHTHLPRYLPPSLLLPRLSFSVPSKRKRQEREKNPKRNPCTN